MICSHRYCVFSPNVVVCRAQKRRDEVIARQISPRSPPFEMITGPRAAAPVQSAMERGQCHLNSPLSGP